MQLFKKAKDLQKYLSSGRKKGEQINFVPTMGALHAGHLSLLDLALHSPGITVCSLFVNPTQFNDRKDFEKYPAPIETDINLLEGSGCRILFYPNEKEIYPDSATKPPRYELGHLETVLEGHFRPGHFQGVCQVVSILLGIVQPDRLFLGRKDYQQCLVIKRLLEIEQNTFTNIVTGVTIREPHGLAMSSRNTRLSPEAREKAAGLYKGLSFIKQHLKPGNLAPLKMQALDILDSHGFRVDYLTVCNASDLHELEEWDGKEKAIALGAAYLEGVRLIDNITLND